MKRLLCIFVSCILIIGLVSCNQGNNNMSDDNSKDKSEDTVRIALVTGALCHAPIHVAIENGYFDEEGLKYEEVEVNGAVIQEAVGANQVDAGFGLIAKFIQPLENGLPLKITSGMHTGCTKLLVKKESGIKSVADLKNKKIGVPGLADSATITTKRALARRNIGVASNNLEVDFLPFSSADLPAALNNDSVDAIAVSDPIATNAEEEYKLDVIIDTATDEEFKDEYCCVSFVSAELASKHPDLAAKFTRAVQKGSAWVQKHPRETAQMQIEKGYVSGDLEANAKMLEHYYYNPSVSGGYDALETVSRELQDIGILKESTDIDAFIKNSFINLDDVPDTAVIEE